MSLQSLRKLLDNRNISATELCEQYLKKIDIADKKINSYITVCKESALKQAQSAQKIIDSGNSQPLTGIPLSVKDNICTFGIKTTCASKMLKDFIPPYNATVIEKLNCENAVILGKTNMDEFAMGSSSQTSFFGGVRNPFDTKYVSGGSSGGAAASVAANLCAVALGSDTGGSVRQPAAFCGITGLKPTYGTVSRHGLIAFASSLDQIGILAKSAADTGYVLNCISGVDVNDATTSSKVSGNYLSKIGMSLSSLVIGLPEEFFSSEISENIKKSVLSAAQYYESLGCTLKKVSLPSLEYAVSAYYLISSAEAASNLSRYDGIKYGYRTNSANDFDNLVKRSRSESLGEEVKRRIMLGNYALSGGYYDTYYKNALRIRSKLRSEYNDIFKECDVILTPTTPDTAFKIGTQENNPVKMYLADICTVTANIAGLPAINTPCGYADNNLPIGMSLIGKEFDESLIIAVADRFEQDFDRKEAIL